ncbi:MAG: hypothetical protein WCO56_15030 [Verrucomicrobiota bacterium]
MNDNLAKLLSTLAIWTATALIFILGFFKCPVNGFAVFVWGGIGMGLAFAPAIATTAIWKHRETPTSPNSTDAPPKKN